jgi:hypothetical protein
MNITRRLALANINKRLLFGASALTALGSRATEVSAWPGMFWSSAAACPAIPAATPPAGNFYASTGLSGATAPFGAGDTVTLNAALSPDNTVDAMRFTEGTANAGHLAYVNGGVISGSVNGPVDLFCSIKQGAGSRNVYLAVQNSGFSLATNVIINPSTGAIVQAASTSFTATAHAAVWPTSNGFWTVWLHTSSIVDATGLNVQFQSASGTNISYAGDGSSSWLAWGVGVYTP